MGGPCATDTVDQLWNAGINGVKANGVDAVPVRRDAFISAVHFSWSIRSLGCPGARVTWCPVASRIAARIADVELTVGGSPAPRAP
jgi:hypothetical protein